MELVLWLFSLNMPGLQSAHIHGLDVHLPSQ